MRLVEFKLEDRLEMATIYFITMGLILSIPLLVFFPDFCLSIILLTALMTYTMYIIFPYFPMRSGFAKVVLSELFFLLIIASFSALVMGDPLGLPHLMIMSVIVAAVIGVDFNGTSPTHKSDLGEIFYRHGYKRMPFLTGVYHLSPYGSIRIDEERCSGCTLCYQVCPRGVYEMDLVRHKAKIVQIENCVNCSACVRQCPERCLTIV